MAAGPLELMAKARAGEADALGELCALYRNYLRMVVRTGLGPKLRERVELSDVVQEALVEVVRQFPQFTGQNEAALKLLAKHARYIRGLLAPRVDMKFMPELRFRIDTAADYADKIDRLLKDPAVARDLTDKK